MLTRNSCGPTMADLWPEQRPIAGSNVMDDAGIVGMQASPKGTTARVRHSCYPFRYSASYVKKMDGTCIHEYDSDLRNRNR